MPEAIDPQEHEQDQQQPAPSSEPCLEPAARSPKIIRLRRRNLENIVLQAKLSWRSPSPIAEEFVPWVRERNAIDKLQYRGSQKQLAPSQALHLLVPRRYILSKARTNSRS
jgi:hypothetical protein